MPMVRVTGGGTSETVLWTNSSPTSAFAAQTITLSDDVTNYEQIKIILYVSTTNQNEGYVIFSPESLINAGVGTQACAISASPSTDLSYTRFVSCSTNTSMKFTVGYRANSSGYSTSCPIPCQVIGIK